MKIRVLVVDDAVIVRNRVSKILSSVSDIEVAGVAASGKIALLKIPQINPDVVILDVEMPDMNGLETLTAIRENYPKLPVIMFSTSTIAGAVTTLDALLLGANDYATKPSNLRSIEATNQHVLTELVPKIRIFGELNTSPTVHKPYPLAGRISSGVDIVAIGVSTGGPNALTEILPDLPVDFPVPIVIVQHMPPVFTKLLAERLASKCQIRVSEAISDTTIQPGQAWIAPGNFHLIVERRGNTVKLVTNQAPPENSCRPAVDVLFRSVAKVYGNKSLGVVLTGMGQDGLRGAEHIRACGGHIFVQDQASSVVWGMPGFVANAGLAESILPINQMAGAILQLVRHNVDKTFI